MSNLISFCFLLGWISIILIGAIWCRKKIPDQKELSRKIVHIGIGPIIALAWWLDISKELALPIASIITIFLIINYKLGFINAIEDVGRKSFGTINYGVSITILLLFLWPKNQDAVTAGIMAMSFGDGLAGLIGRQLSTPSWMILGQKKSIAGTLTMGIIVGIILFSICLISGITLNIYNLLILTIIAIGLEQLGPWGIDNLTVPIGVSLGWLYLIRS